jgi:hypothetical protein
MHKKKRNLSNDINKMGRDCPEVTEQICKTSQTAKCTSITHYIRTVYSNETEVTDKAIIHITLRATTVANYPSVITCILTCTLSVRHSHWKAQRIPLKFIILIITIYLCRRSSSPGISWPSFKNRSGLNTQGSSQKLSSWWTAHWLPYNCKTKVHVRRTWWTAHW